MCPKKAWEFSVLIFCLYLPLCSPVSTPRLLYVCCTTSQTLRKKSCPKWRFLLQELPPLNTLEIPMTGNKWLLDVNIFWNCTFRFSKQEHSVFILTKCDFPLEAEVIFKWPFDWDFALLQCNVPVSCLKQIPFALESKTPSS